MIQKIRSYTLMIAIILMGAVPVSLPAVAAFADCTNIANQVQLGSNQASGATGATASCATQSNTNPTDLATVASKVVNFFSVVVGFVSVIMIIYGGFRYITSGGDSGRVGNAKNTLIYAIIGLVIVALAQVLVHFVLNNVGQVTPGAT
jgi:hypothetical protein